MFLQPNTPDNYASMQQIQTQVAILRARLDRMRLDHPDRAALVTEFASVQGRLTVAREEVQRFGALGFTC
jgi:hypothetical protein